MKNQIDMPYNAALVQKGENIYNAENVRPSEMKIFIGILLITGTLPLPDN